MSNLNRVAFIGNSPPRRCGIATFTSDLQQAVARSAPEMETMIVAMNDYDHTYGYPPSVSLQIRDQKIEDYARAAEVLNASGVDVVCLQHEFGIFGGEAGSHVLELMSRLNMPIVTTFHTVLAQPNAAQKTVLTRIARSSAKVIVMAEKGRELLTRVYNIPAEMIDVIPHGIPDMAFVEPDVAKASLGFSDRSVILTFGLLSPNKGIEVMIDAMPLILKSCPDAVYVVLGATHPHLIRNQGEAYRESLVARVHALGIEEHVVFQDQFVDLSTLLQFISMSDVYVTPYLNEAQMTSGTLAYSFGLGKAVVSTPYWHASELLAEGRGILVPFGDAQAIGTEVAGLLTDHVRRNAIRSSAYASSRPMIWDRVAERYLNVFKVAEGLRRVDEVNVDLGQRPVNLSTDLPETELSYFLTMCDDTGLFQHAVHSVPDRSHGYCVDDNARALLLASMLNAPGETPLSDRLTSRFAAFVQHAWNAEQKHFRNFMGFDRRWLEDKGSEDSHGRTLWALGECARSDASGSRRSWAASLFAEALPIVATFRSPRAWAFVLIGLDGYCAVRPEDIVARQMRLALADRLMELLARVETDDWVWFEEGLSYDNARLPQALIATGLSSGVSSYVRAGTRALRWLMTHQTALAGHFRPIGTDGFSEVRKRPHQFDQQPLEVAATMSACFAAWQADHATEWEAGATNAFEWFLGSNDLSAPLVDLDLGACRDGLHRLRANENMGGESVVSYLMALIEFRQFRGVSARPVVLRHGRAKGADARLQKYAVN